MCRSGNLDMCEGEMLVEMAEWNRIPGYNIRGISRVVGIGRNVQERMHGHVRRRNACRDECEKSIRIIKEHIIWEWGQWEENQ